MYSPILECKRFYNLGPVKLQGDRLIRRRSDGFDRRGRYCLTYVAAARIAATSLARTRRLALQLT